MPVVYIGLGTNLGDRELNLAQARETIAQQAQILRSSAIYETAPWGYSDQPAFLNQVLKVRTRLSPLDLLHFLKTIENEMGRQINFKYGPRLIDLDILLYGKQVVDEPSLQIPHPHLAQRAFVLVPLAEIAPNLGHPLLRKRMSSLLKLVEGREGVKRWVRP